VRASQLNEQIALGHPGADAMLSPLGRRAYMPMGIPQQADQARHVLRKATIGQITDGDGNALVLPSLGRHFQSLDAGKALLYAPQFGIPALRDAWRARLEEPAGTPMSLPLVTAGMTHGLSLCADLFGSPDVPVIIAAPYWDNYDQIFTMRTGAPILTWPVFDAERRLNVPALARVLAEVGRPSMVVINFPSNPTGYSPYPDEVQALVRALADAPHPVAIVCDDAYNGLFFDRGLYGRSVFGALARALDPKKAIVAKVDGATKELVFFGGRVGFLTFSATGAAGEALAEKAAAILRGTMSSVSAPNQAVVLDALRSPTLKEEQAHMKGILARRYEALRAAFDAHGIQALPFNSGCFALIALPAGQDCEDIRQRLIRDHDVGVIAMHAANALRVAYCSIEAEDIPDMVDRIVAGLRRA
jgi:aspartate/methionine/tyrosine aminotransferase